MKLSDSMMSLRESNSFNSVLISDEDEGIKWNFRYDNFETDPTPEVLLLGAYEHPDTHNNLIGGINLHYLNKEDIEKLSYALPKIMRGNDLSQRFDIGNKILPNIFGEYYRTYDSEFMRGVNQDIMYPKYGYMKTMTNWVKNKTKNIFRPKDRKQEEGPKYSPDLQAMKDRLYDVVEKLRSDKNDDVPDDNPEIIRARRQDSEFESDTELQKADSSYDLPNQDDYVTQDVEKSVDDAEEASYGFDDEANDTIGNDTVDKDIYGIEKERAENLSELTSDIDESIRYYSPIRRRYIIESWNGIQQKTNSSISE